MQKIVQKERLTKKDVLDMTWGDPFFHDKARFITSTRETASNHNAASVHRHRSRLLFPSSTSPNSLDEDSPLVVSSPPPSRLNITQYPILHTYSASHLSTRRALCENRSFLAERRGRSSFRNPAPRGESGERKGVASRRGGGVFYIFYRSRSVRQ